MAFKPMRMYDSLAEGKYKGNIIDIYFSNDSTCWFRISVDSIENGVFNTMFTTIDMIFNNFAINYVNEKGYFCPEKAIDKNIEFVVENRVYADKQVSKITEIKEIK